MARFRLAPNPFGDTTRPALALPPAPQEPDPVVVGKRFDSLKERNPLDKDEKVSLAVVIVGAVLCGVVAWFAHRQVQRWRARQRAVRLEAERKQRRLERRKALGLAPPRVYSLRAGSPALMEERTPRDLLRIKLPCQAVIFDASEGSRPVEILLDRVVVPGFHFRVPPQKAALPDGDVFLARREAGGEVTVFPAEIEPARGDQSPAAGSGKLDRRSPSLRFLRHGRQDCRLRATLQVLSSDRSGSGDPLPLEIMSFGLQSAIVSGPMVLGEREEAELLVAFPQALESSRFHARIAPPEVGEPTHQGGTRLVIEAATDVDLFQAARFLALQNMDVNDDDAEASPVAAGATPVAQPH